MVAFAAASSLLVLGLWLGLACSRSLTFVGSSPCLFLWLVIMTTEHGVLKVGNHLASLFATELHFDVAILSFFPEELHELF